jgi:hypothetical protein
MTDRIVTDDWKEFGYRERKMAIELLTAYNEGKTTIPASNFMGGHPRAAFNKNSGYVFLTDDEYNAFMLNAEGVLDIFLSCPNCGNEGFPSMLVADPHCEDCKPYADDFLEAD